MIWHYSFNEELVREDGKPLNKWSPSPNEPHIPIGKTYWFLRLTTFDDFLKRRSALSHNPKKHFPSVETYYKNNNDCKLEYLSFDKKRFIEVYDALRDGGHSAKKILKDINMPEKWYRLVLFGKESMAWLADDGKSASLLNLASVKDGRGLGIRMLVELVKYLCENGYKYFDAGISGDYGGYKRKIFLDAITG